MGDEVQAGWVGAGNPDEHTTYVTRPPVELPALPEVALDGTFRWLPTPGRDLDWAISGSPAPTFDVESVDRVERLAAERGIELPPPFVRFLRSEKRSWVRSFTGCWLDLPTRLVTLPGTDQILIRFLNDQQGVVFWYLVVSPTGEDLGVVVSEDLFDFDAPEPWREQQAQPPVLCARSFEEFMLRYWLESEIAFRTTDGEPLSDLQREYAERWHPHR